jgi:superfamily II RNA helicase
MQFKSFTLDPFQEEAILAIDRNESVVVSAATGTGKTLIADYAIDKFMKMQRRVVYTAPIKALSNQKFKDFKHDYGADNVGIMTGDVVINPQAPILVMTTEIYRNMLLARDRMVMDISYVVFDEIHYMNDPERGTVWEESIIFSPPHVRFICLSATIPNAAEFAGWMEFIKKHKVLVVKYDKRAVPLQHFVFDTEAGLTTAAKLQDHLSIPSYHQVRGGGRRRGGEKSREAFLEPPKIADVILEMHDKLPAIVFSFSRKACEDLAFNLIQRHDFVSPPELKKIIDGYRKYFTPEVNRMKTTAKLRSCLSKGVGFHHAGLLPQHKEAVEELFGAGLLKVLFATETFSVGINMPAKTVVFNGLRKFDGANFRMIDAKEYFQLAGRAGRRGIDTVGYVVAMIDRRDNSVDELIRISKVDDVPIRSQFQLSFNTVLNLVVNHTPDEIEIILRSNFDNYLKQRSSERQVRVMASFNSKKRLLMKMRYIDNDDKLTAKGFFARYIYFEELLVSEIFTSKLYSRLSDTELLQLLAGIIYEQRKNDYFSFKGVEKEYDKLMKKICAVNDFVEKNTNKLSLKRMMLIVGKWSNGAAFDELMPCTNLAEGDIIRLFRRIIDMIGQVRRATDDNELIARLDACEKKIDRGLVAVEF